MGVVSVRHDAGSVAEVRHRIATDLAAAGIGRDQVDDVVLVAGELVANAVTHAVEPVELDWQRDGDTVLVQVSDGSTEPPRPTAPDLTAGSGRGLAIVAAISREWGVRPRPDGKQVWARVPVS